MTAKRKPKKWIASATENSHGQFKAKAEKAGESTTEYAKEKVGAPGKLGKEARLAEALMGMHHKHKPRSAKDIRGRLYGAK